MTNFIPPRPRPPRPTYETVMPPKPRPRAPFNPSRTPNKFTLEAYLLCFDQAHDVFHHRFTSKAGKRRAALIMYLCEAALGNLRKVCIPEAVEKRFPRAMFLHLLALPSREASLAAGREP